MKTLEEITYDAGRHALADQKSVVSGIRQRAGTLVAAHAVVASFLGGTVLRDDGLQGWGWVAVVALVLALSTAAILLAPWTLKFAVDATELYPQLYTQAEKEAATDTLGWLVSAGTPTRRFATRTPGASHECLGYRPGWRFCSSLKRSLGSSLWARPTLWRPSRSRPIRSSRSRPRSASKRAVAERSRGRPSAPATK